MLVETIKFQLQAKKFPQMKDVYLLPYILPNVFLISTALSATQFAAMVLPSLKPLFTIKDPPQNMLTLLENLPTLQSKTEKGVFRERTYGCWSTTPWYVLLRQLSRGLATCLQCPRI